MELVKACSILQLQEFSSVSKMSLLCFGNFFPLLLSRVHLLESGLAFELNQSWSGDGVSLGGPVVGVAGVPRISELRVTKTGLLVNSYNRIYLLPVVKKILTRKF